MKVFIIPSWFPSKSNPYYGIFIKEQLEFLAKERPNWQVGVSTWGQGDSRKLLWAKDHFINLKKIFNHSREQPCSEQISSNLHHYYHPALSWTKRFKRGNLNSIIKASESNFNSFKKKFGKPDILWVQASYPGAFVGRHLSLKYEIPYIVHVRFGGFMFENLLKDLGGMKDGFLESINKANLVTTTSGSQLRSIQSYIPFATVLHNPVDTNFFNLDKSKNEGKGILAIGRFEKEKGFDILIEAMKGVDSNLTIVGTGSLWSKFQAYASKLGLENKISFIGEMNRLELKETIQRCSFLVLPSTYETFGNVLLEAMACGKPLVATKCGGPEEIVSETSGYLCEPNPVDLSEKMNSMLSNRSSFDAIKIRNEVETKFSPRVWADSVEKIFRSVM